MITFQVEEGTGIIEELKPMFPEHYEELALNKDKVPLDPQYDIYVTRILRGEGMVITARELGRIVGYFVGFVAPGLHYKTCLTLTMDIFYIHPDYRGKSLGIRLFKAVEKEAKRRGIQRAFFGSKLHKDASWLFEHLGYQPCELYYTAWLGD